MPKITLPRQARTGPAVAESPAVAPAGGIEAHDRLSQHPVLSLQRAIGNQAVRQLLQRDRDDTAMLSKVAKELSAAALVNDVAAGGTEPADFGFARQIRKDQKDGIKPGLNITANLGARGRTGFVAADGTYLGDTLPAATAQLPRIAISIDKQAFDEGENTVRGTLRHELEHAMHAQLLLVVQRRWRESLAKAKRSLPTSEAQARKELYAFAAGPTASPSGGKLAQFQIDLIRGDIEASLGSTELLAHLAGFMQVFETTPPADPSAIPKGLMPPAIEQLRGAAKNGWPGASDKVKAEARDRVVTYYRSLAPARQLLLRDWLMFIRFRAVTAWPKGAGTQDAKAAAIVHDAFSGHIDFVDWMLEPIRDLVFKDSALPATSPHTAVTLPRGPRPKPAATDSVGSGKVTIHVDAPFTFTGDGTKRDHGISLLYEGSDAPQVRWLQFIWREVVPDGGKGIAGTGAHQGISYPLTTDPTELSQIGWNTDTATYRGASGEGAFYEKDNAVNRDKGSVEMFDEPSSPFPGDVTKAFAARASGGGVTGRAHLVQFLVKDKAVLYRAEIVYEFRFAAATDTPAGQPKLVSHGKASAIDPGARARLHQQFPQVDFLQ
ncbi:MAG TPA: hypothetical protein VHV28_17980 [Solirubrobacteraceae bacterium]|nr:hypothetical protein [Solirubrobacteraceae bacterium]